MEAVSGVKPVTAITTDTGSTGWACFIITVRILGMRVLCVSVLHYCCWLPLPKPLWY